MSSFCHCKCCHRSLVTSFEFRFIALRFVRRIVPAHPRHISSKVTKILVTHHGFVGGDKRYPSAFVAFNVAEEAAKLCPCCLESGCFRDTAKTGFTPPILHSSHCGHSRF